jgi:antitoxin ParD1/3/4
MSAGGEWVRRYKSGKGFESGMQLPLIPQSVILLVEVFMEVNLAPELEDILRKKVESGQFSSIEEAANEMLALAIKEETLANEDLAELQREVQLGIEQADRGEFVEFTAEQIISEYKGGERKQKAG